MSMDFMELARAFFRFFDSYFFAILIATGVLFLLMFITYTIYRTLSKRDIFRLIVIGGKQPSFWQRLLYLLQWIAAFPIFTYIGFLIFAFSLFMLMKPQTEQEELIIFFVAIVIVSTIRVSAYVHQKMAEDLAKLVPLSMLTIVLSNPSFERIGISWDRVLTFSGHLPVVMKYFAFTLVLEIILRLMTMAAGTEVQGEIDED
jgi:hypothetical protein